MIEAVVHGLLRALLIPVIAVKKAKRLTMIKLYDDLSRHAGLDGLAILIHDHHIILRDRFAHGAGLRLHAHEIGNQERRFRLAKAFHELDASSLIPLVKHIRLSASPAMVQ